MAEQEVAKHTKNVYKIWNSKEHGVWHKVKEFLIEIIIITFAVSLSIGFHNWSEHRKEQQEVKTFLLGLKEDISDDVDEVKYIMGDYKRTDSIYRYLSQLKRDQKPDKDSFAIAVKELDNNKWLRPNASRYDGFKSSGKLDNIENDSLLNNILYLYQEAIPQLKSSEDGWLTIQRLLRTYLLDNLAENADGSNNYFTLLTSIKGRYLCRYLIQHPQFRQRYQQIIDLGQSIIKSINNTYGLK